MGWNSLSRNDQRTPRNRNSHRRDQGMAPPKPRKTGRFFDLQPIREIPPHTHCAQWGLVLDGKMEFTIAGETKIYEKGDWYYIPEGVEHSAKFLTRVYVIDMFDTNDRYKIKTS